MKKVLYTKCEQAVMDVDLVEMKEAFHAFAPIGIGSPETKQILEENIEFMHIYSTASGLFFGLCTF